VAVLARYRWWVVDHPWRSAFAFALSLALFHFVLSLGLGRAPSEAILIVATRAVIVFALLGLICSSRFYQRRERSRLGLR
jgi:hypothetical protein